MITHLKAIIIQMVALLSFDRSVAPPHDQQQVIIFGSVKFMLQNKV